jgi:DNA-binding SARP family transcriptional activator
VESGIRLGRETGVLLWERIIRGHGVEAALTEGDTATAAPWLQELEDGLDPQLDWDYCQYHHLACLQALLQGEAARAREHARRNFSAISGNSVLYLEALCRLDLVESLRTCGELSAAAAELKAAWKLIEEIESRLFHFMACMCEASLALDTGEEGMALDALHKGLAIGRESDIRNCWSWRSTVMQHLCVTALENGVEVPYVQSLITERNLIPDKPPQAVDDWPWPVRIRTLGEFSMQVYGKSLDFTGKAQKKPLELLKVLLAFGGREVPLRRLEETVWPDAEGDAAHRSFGTALHRLRKLLGGHDTLVLEPNTLSLNPRYCQVDSWVCERILGELDRALQTASDREVRKIGRDLFKRYRGPFLRAETDAAWVLAPRERLQRRMLRSALKLGRYWEARQDWQQAADVYSRGLNIESRNGTLCQRLMLAYRNQGLRPEAMLAYRQYRDSLPDQDEPLPAIRALYETIANGRASLG